MGCGETGPSAADSCIKPPLLDIIIIYHIELWLGFLAVKRHKKLLKTTVVNTDMVFRAQICSHQGQFVLKHTCDRRIRSPDTLSIRVSNRRIHSSDIFQIKICIKLSRENLSSTFEKRALLSLRRISSLQKVLIGSNSVVCLYGNQLVSYAVDTEKELGGGTPRPSCDTSTISNVVVRARPYRTHKPI